MNCNHNNGFYVKRIDSYWQFYSPQGEAEGTVDTGARYGIVAYCASCHKRLGRTRVEPTTGIASILENEQ